MPPLDDDLHLDDASHDHSQAPPHQGALWAWQMWHTLDSTAQLDQILQGNWVGEDGRGWTDEDSILAVFAHFREDARKWGRIMAACKEAGYFGPDVTKAVDAYRLAHPAPEVVSRVARRFPFVDLRPMAPALPTRARVDHVPRLATWLDEYAAHSAYWAPRAAPAYHEAVGLWVLSTIAARRIVVEMGSTPLYPSLFLALVSESTHWTKTTAASIGTRLLRRAGCGHLLAPDRTTPQFLLKMMTGLLPTGYSAYPPEAQQEIRDGLGFAAQRGWFYEEWGGMLQQMKRADSPQADLNKLLIVLEGGAETFETGTIQRGLERIKAPYLALLGNATLHDLVPYMHEGHPWWHDGFWPRFACITPPYKATPSRAPRPREPYHLPATLILPLSHWHKRLGNPTVTVEEDRQGSKLTGHYVITVGQLPCQTLRLTGEVYDAYERYNDALLELTETTTFPRDLGAWYGRAHDKALRVAMLLASLHGEDTINLTHWARAQNLVETWRTNLHDVLVTVSEQTPLSKEAQIEAKIERLLVQSGGMTARELQKHLYGVSGDVLQKMLSAMERLGMLYVEKIGKKNLYTIFEEEADGTS